MVHQIKLHTLCDFFSLNVGTLSVRILQKCRKRRNLKKSKMHCIELKGGSPNQVTTLCDSFYLNVGTLSVRILQ